MFCLMGAAVVGLTFMVFSPNLLMEFCDLNCNPALDRMTWEAPGIEYCPKIESVSLEVPLSLAFIKPESSVDPLPMDFWSAPKM